MRTDLILTSKPSGRVTLRVPSKADLAFIRALWADPETMAAVGGPVEMTEEEMSAWYARMIDPGRGTDLYTIIYDEQDRPVGEVSFHRLDWATRQADFNIKVAATRRRQGYGREALVLLLDFFFLEMGGERMTDDLDPDNRAGQQALEAIGFRHNPDIPGVYRLEITHQEYLNRPGTWGRLKKNQQPPDHGGEPDS